MAQLPEVAILMGSDSDYPTMQAAIEALDLFGISYEVKILSAHRTADDVALFSKKASDVGFRVLICGAGGAAHLPGMVASYTELPVIGVPVPLGSLGGEDALLSIVQMPKGVPVATVAIGNAFNAGLLAVQILSVDSTNRGEQLRKQFREYKDQLAEKVRRKRLPK